MLYIGVDVHKKNLSICVLDEESKILRQCKIANELPTVCSFFKEYQEDTKVALEASHNWGALYDLFSEMGLDVSVCDAREARLIGYNKVKTDKNDAFRLAQLLAKDFLPTCYVPTGTERELRELVRTRAYLTRNGTKLKNQIHADLSAQWVKHEYSDLFGKQGRDFLRKLSINEAYKISIITRLNVLENIDQQINYVNISIKQRASLDLRAKLLTTIPGIADFSALVILAEIGTISRFPRAESLVNYSGLHPGEDSSGERQKRGRITKEGSRWLRWILVEAALHTIRKEGKIRDLYTRVCYKKGHNKAIVAAAREMLVSIYWMLTRMEPYRLDGRCKQNVLTSEAR